MSLTQMMLACGIAFIFSVTLTPIVRDIFRSYNVVDRPGRRKVHAYPIPRVGGIPIMIAYVLALNSLRGPDSVFPVNWLQTILSGAAIIFLIRLDHLGNIALPVWLSLLITVFWLLLA